MSDSFQAYVFADALVAEGRADFRRIPSWLIAEEIISVDVADNVLGQPEGHRPGRRAATIVAEDNADWRNLQVNGVSLKSGRQIQAAAELEYARCPKCANVVRSDDEAFGDISESLDAFSDGRDDGVKCRNCGQSSELSQWDFGGRLAAGFHSVKFWNWPEQVPELALKMAEIAGMKCTKVWGTL